MFLHKWEQLDITNQKHSQWVKHIMLLQRSHDDLLMDRATTMTATFCAAIRGHDVRQKRHPGKPKAIARTEQTLYLIIVISIRSNKN